MFRKKLLAASLLASLLGCGAAFADIARDSDGDVLSTLHIIVEYGSAPRDAAVSNTAGMGSPDIGNQGAYSPASSRESLTVGTSSSLRAPGRALADMAKRPDAVGRRVNPESFGLD